VRDQRGGRLPVHFDAGMDILQAGVAGGELGAPLCALDQAPPGRDTPLSA
jgi:hypothetical protein